MRFSTISSALALALSFGLGALAAPAPAPAPLTSVGSQLLVPGPPTSDAPLSLPTATYAAAFACPSGGSGSNYVLLVPGTGATGPESYDNTYVPLTQKLGYTPCYISPPPYMLNDSQINAEYVVYAIRQTYKLNGNKPVPVIGWSQGNLVIQWALTFFPSTQGQVDRFISFAGDFKGTIFAYALDAQPFGIAPSVWQQSTFSAFLAALKNAGGLQAKVPTTSIYSATDEIVQPESGGPALESSYLPGAANVRVQDTCGPAFLLEHGQELWNAFSYAVAKAALASPTGRAEPGSYSAADCSEGFPAPLTPQQDAAASTIIATAAVHIVAGPRTGCEPPLKQYARPYDPVAIQACNPLAQVITTYGPQTPPLFNDYYSMVNYILTH